MSTETKPDQSLESVNRGQLSRNDARRAYLAEVVPEKTVIALNQAHEMFFGALASTDLSPVERTMLTAKATTSLRDLFRGPVLDEIIMPLMNTPMGFDTDKNPAKAWGAPPAPYGEDVVLDCAVEATLSGLPMVGNVWNIIGGRMYIRKEGFERLVGDMCRYTVSIEVPQIPKEIYSEGGYLTVNVRIKHSLHGSPEDQDPKVFHGQYKVRMNKKLAVPVENAEGKAKRKALRDLYGELTGVLLPDSDGVQEGTVGVHQVGAHYGAEISISDLTPDTDENGEKAMPDHSVKPEEPKADGAGLVADIVGAGLVADIVNEAGDDHDAIGKAISRRAITKTPYEPTVKFEEPVEEPKEEPKPKARPKPRKLSGPKVKAFEKRISENHVMLPSDLRIEIKEEFGEVLQNLRTDQEDELDEFLKGLGA